METTTKRLRTLFDTLHTFNDQCTLTCNGDGWTATAISPDHVCMCVSRIGAQMFDGPPMDGMFEIDLSKTVRILRDMGENTDITVDGGRMYFRSGGLDLSIGILSDVMCPSAGRKDWTFDSGATVCSDVLRPMFRLGKGLSEQEARHGAHSYVSMSFGTETMEFTVQGDVDVDRIRNVVPGEKMYSYRGNGSRAVYPFEYLCKVVDCIPKGGLMEFEATTDWPLHIMWGTDGVDADWFIAPRVETEL